MKIQHEQVLCTPIPRPLTGLILAGGKSSRMGQDKALLPFRQSTLLDHQASLLNELCGNLLVSGSYPGYECVADEFPSLGPAGGILAASRALPHQSILVVPIDMPAIARHHLMTLCAHGKSCHYQNQPLPAFFADSSLVSLAISSMLASGQNSISMWELHKALNCDVLDDCRDTSAFANVNTPEQWLTFLDFSAAKGP